MIAGVKVCEECRGPWENLVNGRCPRCGNRTFEMGFDPVPVRNDAGDMIGTLTDFELDDDGTFTGTVLLRPGQATTEFGPPIHGYSIDVPVIIDPVQQDRPYRDALNVALDEWWAEYRGRAGTPIVFRG